MYRYIISLYYISRTYDNCIVIFYFMKFSSRTLIDYYHYNVYANS